MSEFKVGDWVVFTEKKSCDCDLYEVEAVLDSGRFLGISQYRQAFSAKNLRHATNKEIAAGHRIDEPCIHLSRTFMGDDGVQTCFDCGDKLQSKVLPRCQEKESESLPCKDLGVVTKDVRETFEGWFKREFEYAGDYFTITHFDGGSYKPKNNWNPIENEAAWVLTASFKAWQARQVEIDHLKSLIEQHNQSCMAQCSKYNDKHDCGYKNYDRDCPTCPKYNTIED